jgi:energy-coupling factor transporter ATP-binding protein EcfA2
MASKKIPSTNKIKRIDIDGLFGLHSYSIDFPADGSFSLLIGPNGIGKTTVLGMVEFLADPFDSNPEALFQTQFSLLRVTYENGETITAQKKGRYHKTLPVDFTFSSANAADNQKLCCQCSYGDFLSRETTGLTKLSPGFLKFFGSYLQVFGNRGVYSDFYSNPKNGSSTLASIGDIGNYAFHHPSCRFFRADHIADDVFLVFFYQRFAHVGSCDLMDRCFYPRYWHHRFMEGRWLKGSKQPFQEQIDALISTLQTEYAYFHRHFYLPSGGWPDFIYNQENFRFLRDIAQSKLPFFSSAKFPDLFNWDPAKKPLSTMHRFFSDLPDAERNIPAMQFSDLLLTMRAFSVALQKLLDNVSNMGRGRVSKSLSFTSTGKLVFKPVAGSSFGFEKLSTGEKNYLVLLMNILFESTMANSLDRRSAIYLIDEPEISMHIEMQKELSRKLREICDETGCQIICATHSPFLADGDERLFANLEYHFPKD